MCARRMGLADESQHSMMLTEWYHGMHSSLAGVLPKATAVCHTNNLGTGASHRQQLFLLHCACPLL